jgi:hypothetical protein
MAAVIEKTGYVSIGTMETVRNGVSLGVALRDAARSVRFLLAALSAEIALLSGSMSLLENSILISCLVLGFVFCYAMDSVTKPSYLKLYRIGISVLFGVLMGLVIKGLIGVEQLGFLSMVPIMAMTIGGIVTATRLGRFVTSD